MPRVTTNPLQKLGQSQWPQDTLSPPILSGMPAVSKGNVNLRRESFIISGKLLQINYGTFNLSLPVSPAGDFWCRSISAYCPTMVSAPADPILYQPYAQVQITDGRTGYSLFQPYIPFAALTGTAPTFVVSGVTTNPADVNIWCPQATSDLPELYCFTRNSTIGITVNRQFVAGQLTPDLVDLYFAFGGWLEYANATG